MPVPGYAIEILTAGFPVGALGYDSRLIYVRNSTTNVIGVFDYAGNRVGTITTGLVPTGIYAAADDTLILLHNTDKKLYKVDKNGVTIAVSNALSGPTNGMGIMGDSAVFVSTTGFAYIYTIDWTNFQLYLVSTINIGAFGTTPRGCDFVPGGGFVVCFDDTTTLSLFTSEGMMIKNVPTPASAANNPIDVKYLTANSQYLCSVSTPQKVYITPVDQPE